MSWAKENGKLTVGDLRRALEGVSDDSLVILSYDGGFGGGFAEVVRVEDTYLSKWPSENVGKPAKTLMIGCP